MIQYKTENVTVFQSALYKTTSTVIQTDDAIILTDPNWLPDEILTIQTYVKSIRNGRDLYLILTHSDFDHIIGVNAFPDATIIASRALAHHSSKDKIISDIYEFDQAYYIERPYTPTFPYVDHMITHDGETVTIGECTLTFYFAPGHTEDSLFTIVEPYGVFLAGDYLSDVEFPFIDHSYTAYVQTIEKAEHLWHTHTSLTLIPGHGHTTTSMATIKERIQQSKTYLQALRNPPSSLEDTLQNMYPFYDGMRTEHLKNLNMVQKKD